MSAFKLFTGNYLTVLDNLGMPLEFAGTQSPTDYNNAIAKDLDRICYLNYHGNVEGMKRTLSDHSGLSDQNLSYTQGNFFVGIFSQIKVTTLPKYLSKQEEAVGNQWPEFYNGLEFHYVDDDGIPCGFSLVFLIDDQDTLPLEERQRPFALSIIRDVTKAPEDRKVTYISHESLMHSYPGNNGPLLEKNSEDLESDQVTQVLQAALNSKTIATLLRGIIQDESIDMETFLALDRRIMPNKNIDDRDPKLAALFHLYVLWTKILADSRKNSEKTRLGSEICAIINAAFADVNYFKDKTLSDVEELVRFYKQHPALADLSFLPHALNEFAKHKGFESYEAMQLAFNQSFLQRNLGNLILLSVTLLTTLSLTLVLTGTLASLGFILLPSLPAVLTELGIGTASALTALTTVNLVLDEMDTSTNRSEMQQEVERLTDKDNKDLIPLRKQFQTRMENSFRQQPEVDEIDQDLEEHSEETVYTKPVLARVYSEPMISLGKNRFSKFAKVHSVHNISELEHKLGNGPDVPM